MRPVLPLVLLLAACSTAGGETTTTAPLAEPPTTTTSAPATTTSIEPTTTPFGEECVERDGVLRTSRGFVCPPQLRTWDTGGQGVQPLTDIHLPGTYTLRAFTHPLRFTRAERFTSAGEHPEAVVFDAELLDEDWWVPLNDNDPSRKIYSLSIHDIMATFTEQRPDGAPEDWEWATDRTVTNRVVGGFPAEVTTFTADCVFVTHTMCWFSLPGLDRRNEVHGTTIALVVVSLPDGPFTIVVEATDDFDTYWTEIAQPILDSVEFLDQ